MARKLQPFFKGNKAVYVIESHVKQIMKFATDGDFTELKTTVIFDEGSWWVVFTYKTNYGKGTTKLKAQEIKEVN